MNGMRKRRKKTFRCAVCLYTGLATETHHVISKSDLDGEFWGNYPFNTAELCCNCHDLVTRGVITVYGWRLTSEGYKLFWRGDME